MDISISEHVCMCVCACMCVYVSTWDGRAGTSYMSSMCMYILPNSSGIDMISSDLLWSTYQKKILSTVMSS
jgi:hypothetical protein